MSPRRPHWLWSMFVVGVVGSVVVGAVSCIPSAARTNAKIESGIDIAIGGGGQMLSEGRDQDGTVTDNERFPHAEIALQYGGNVGAGALAIQAKIPIAYVFSTIDLYYQLPQFSDFYVGFGAELGVLPSGYVVLPSGYVVLTQYVNDTTYLSFTPRVLLVGVNPQVALGFDTQAVDISIFASYLRFFGDGININSNFTGDREDLRTDTWLGGLLARF